MNEQQRGALNLWWVGVLSALFALAAMAALFSMRYERNLFAEAWQKVAGAPAAARLAEQAKQAVGAAPATTVLRRCKIDGKTVISNVDCSDNNPTSKTIEIHDTRGVEPPKVPAAPAAAPSSDPVLDKVIERQTR